MTCTTEDSKKYKQKIYQITLNNMFGSFISNIAKMMITMIKATTFSSSIPSNSSFARILQTSYDYSFLKTSRLSSFWVLYNLPYNSFLQYSLLTPQTNISIIISW